VYIVVFYFICLYHSVFCASFNCEINYIILCPRHVRLLEIVTHRWDGRWVFWRSNDTNGDGWMFDLQADSNVKFAAWPASWQPPGADRLSLRCCQCQTSIVNLYRTESWSVSTALSEFNNSHIHPLFPKTVRTQCWITEMIWVNSRICFSIDDSTVSIILVL